MRVTTSVAAALVSSHATRWPSPSDGASWAPEEQETRVKALTPATTSAVLAADAFIGPLQEPRRAPEVVTHVREGVVDDRELCDERTRRVAQRRRLRQVVERRGDEGRGRDEEAPDSRQNTWSEVSWTSET
ncbi:hypothetical protein [Streptomyces sp. NPDC088730]|uniref:hypothetical protein n=1 Tax=Streptomyces sp. NPDC088730 TaxID=3365877 RepID=UPI00380D16FA